MTKLIFIHGINNQGKSSAEIIEEWSTPLNKTLSLMGLDTISREDIEAPYYGDLLDQKSKRDFNIFKDDSTKHLTETEHKILAEMSEWLLHDDLSNFTELHEPRKILDAQLNQPVYVPKGTLGGNQNEDDKGNVKSVLHRKTSIRIATFLSKNFPGIKGPVADLFLRQASVYLVEKNVQKEVNDLVFEQVFKDRDPKDKAIIVSHSLGTVISYFMIDEMLKQYDVQALFTLGSPLGTRYLAHFNPKRDRFPENVGNWLNCYDKRDFVSLNEPIIKERIGFDGMSNSTEFNTSKEDRHSIVSYLSHKNLAKSIREQFDLI